MKTDILTTAADSFTGMPVDTPAENDAGNVFADGSNDFADEEKARRRAQMKAAAKTLFRTDISKMDDAAVAGFYTACARGLFGIEDPDGRVAFGRRAGDARANVGLLRDFCNGNYSVIRDPEYDKWAAMDEERKFRYALERESKSAKVKGYLEGKRGSTFLEDVSMLGDMPAFGPAAEYELDRRSEIQRRQNYEGLNDEEKAKYRADVIGRYEDKLSKRHVLATYLAATEGLSDRAAMLLANTYNGLQKQDRDNPYFHDRGTVDVDAVEALPDDEKDRFYTALAIMRGDRKKGHLLFMPTDFSDDTALNRAQLALYGLQTSVLDLFSDTYAMGRDAARWTYAKTVMGDEARKNYFRRWDAEQRAQRALEQGLPEADSWIGEMVQSLGENSHWFIPYGAIAKGGGLVKAGKAAKATAALRGEVAGIQKAAAQAGAAASGASLGEVGRAAARSGMMTGPGVDLWKRQMAAVEHFTQELRAAGDAARKADTMRKSGRALWTAGQASAFSAFSEEYIANCDAAGISREESVPMSAIVGLVNAKVEQLYVPGLESSLTPVQVKSLMLASGLRAFRSEGAAGFRKWAANYVAKGVSEGVKVTLSEGAVEEPIQQLVTEWGKEIAKSADELRERGWGGIALAWGKFIHDNFAADGGFENFVRNGLGTYVDTAVDMVPSSVGFGLTTNFNAKMGQRRRNRARRRENLKKWEAAKQYALANGREEPVLPRMLSHDASGRVVFNPDGVDYDEGVADVVARAMETRNAIGAYWESKGDRDARAGNRLVQAVTDARAIWRDGDGDKLGRIAETVGVDQKTAEVVCQYLEAESEAEAYSPNVRAWTSINLSSADISEDTIRSVLPGYVDGSFMADAEGGTYAARVRLADGTERTIAYRVGDISAELVADVAENEKEDSAFGRSYDARMKQGAEGAARTWASLSDAERHRIAVDAAARVNGFSSGRAGVLEMKDADGRTVRVNADDVIYLASGRLADVGYSAMAHMGTARHETFHALWRFAATSYTDVQLQEMARTLGVDTASDTWRVDLDEAMAHQMEEYASGHYVTHVAETQLGKLLDSGAAKFIDVLSRFGLGDEVVNAKTGRPFALADFYDAVLRGEIGSGATGVEHVATEAHAPKAESSAAKGAGVPMEVSEEDRAALSADLTAAQAAEQETAAENAPAAPVNAEAAPSKAAPKAGGSLDNPADASVTDARFYRIGAGEGVDIVGELVVSDARDLKTSYKGTLEDASLQNRGETEEGRALVEKIAARPDPLQVGTVQPRANNGFIWATPSGNVFIGNTRESGITKAYERGNAENVRAYMLAEAQRRGLEVPEGCGQPVVHFVLRRIESADGSATIQDVVRMTNESVNRGMNVYETARNDADVLVANNLVPGIALRPDGLVDTDRSADAIGSFRRLTNAQGMIDENTGMLTEEGQTRLSNAVLAALLGNGNADLLRKIVSESARLDIENEKRALMRCAAELMDLAAKKPEFDLRQPLAEALRYYVEWRDADETRRAEAGKSRHDWYARTKDGARRRGLEWADHMAQQDMFRTPSADAKLLGDLLAASRDLRSFEADDRETEAGKQRAQRLVADYIGDYVRNARAVNTETVDMFGTPPASRTDVLEAQRTRDGRRRFSMNVSDETKHYFASRHDTSSWTIRKEPSEVLAMQTVEFGDVQPLSEKTDNRSVRTALKDLFRADDPVLNEESNEKAVFPGSIAGKLMSQSGADMNRIGRLLKPLFKSAVLSWTEPEMKMDGHTFHFENKGYRMFVNKFRVGGDVEMFVRFTVRDQKGDGSRMALHHATVSDVELYKESAADSHPVDKTGDDRAFVDYKLAKFFAPVHGESKVGVRTPPASRTGAFDAANPDIRFSIAERHDELMRSSAEYRDVYDRYHDADGSAKPGWLKAPNGRDTNLEPYQWVQVRTPSFMKWFGDWMAAAEMAPSSMDSVSVKKIVARGIHEAISKGQPLDANDESRIARILEGVNADSSKISDVSVYPKTEASPLPNNQTGRRDATDTGRKPHVDRKVSYFLEGIKDDSSKIVDENGEPLVVYRGASFDPLAQEPGKGVIRPESYFTADPEYAKRYGNVRAYYIRITKPFDVRNAEDVKRLAEFYPAGYQFATGHNGALDWGEMANFELDELREKYPEYDGIVMDEGGDPLPDGSVKYRGVSYMPFDGGAQVKSATDNNGEYSLDNPDVRFSISGIYTGSAADYEKPDLHYIGTGEGSQVYGWGLYASNVRGVAEQYATSEVAHKGMPGTVRKNGKPASGEVDEIVSSYLESASSSFDDDMPSKSEIVEAALMRMRRFSDDEVISKAIKELETNSDQWAIERHSGNIYEQTFFTNRKPGDESHLLSWYEPVSEENLGRILEGLKKEGISDRFKDMYWLRYKGMSSYLESNDIKGALLDNGSTGDAVYQQLTSIIGSPKEASEFLARADIDGVKYPVDSYGKQVKDGEEAGWNYVSFRDDNINVDHKWVDGQKRFSMNGNPGSISDETRREFAEDPKTSRWTVFTEPSVVRDMSPVPVKDIPPVTSALDNNSVEKAIQKMFLEFGDVENKNDGYRVVFNRSDAGKMMMQSGVDMRTFAPQMKHLFETSVHAFDNPQERIPGHKFRKNVIGFRHYVNKVRMADGGEYYIRFTVREETGNRNGVHLATVSDVKLYNEENAGMSGSANKSEGARVFFDRIIAQYLHKGYTKNWRDAFLRFSLDLMRARASAPENAAKAKTPEGKRAEVRGRGRFSFEFPRLDTMSDDELIAAAVATRIALGKSDKASERAVKITTVQKMMKSVHPGWDARKIAVESQRVVQGAQKMARQIRADLDRGVSESLVLEHLPDAMRRQFGAEMRQQARQGARLGTYRQRAATAVEERQARIVEEAVKVQSGVETKLLENAYGVDLSQTLMNLVENPFLKKDKDGNYVPAGAGKQAAEDVTGVVQEDAPQKEVEEHVRRAVDEVVKVSAKKRAEEERARRNRENAAGHDAEVEAAMSAGSGDDGEASLAGADVVDIATRREGINLEDPRQLAHFVVELSRRYWIDSHGLKNDANVWADAVALQFLRKTAANVYGKLAADIAYSQARATAARAIDGFENVPTVQGLLSEMTYVGQVINAKKIRETQQQLCEKLDLFLREKLGAQGRFKPDNEELHRKVSAEVELRARYMRHAMWLTPDAAADEAKEIQREIDIAATDFEGEGHDVDQSRVMVEGIRKLNVLREFGALRYKPVGRIEEAIAYWEDMERGSGEEIAREALDREVRTKKAAAVLARAFHDTARKYVREGRDLGAMLGDYMQSHMGFMNLLRDMTRYASDADAQAAENVFRWLELEIQKAGTAASVEKRRHADALAQAVKQIYGRDFAKVLSEFADEDARFAPFMGTVDGQRVRPTKGRAIQLMVSLLQVGRKIEVEDPEKPGEFIVQWEGGYHDNIVKFHREAQAAQIAALLTPADLNLVKWLGQWYESNRQELSGVCKSLFGIGVYAETSNYFPVKMLLEKQGLEKGDAVGWSIFPRALTPRVKNERDFDTSADVLQMFMSRMEEGAQWKAHARLGLEMRGIFGRAELQAAIAASHGHKANATVLGFVTDTLAGHGTYDRGDNGATYYTDIVRGWAALGALGANVGVMVRQPTSIPAFGFEIGLAKTAKHMLTAFTPDGMDAMRRIFDSDQRKVRWDTGNTEAVKNALASSGSGMMMRLWKASMITNKLGDVVPALVVGQGIYRECLEKGMSEEDAMAYTWMLVERTQQSSRIENQAQFQRRSKYGRAIYQFLSTQQQYLQYELRAVRAVMAKPGDASRWARIAGTVTLNHFILSSAYFWVGAMYRRLLGQEPPEDELKDWTVSMLLGPFGALYGLGLTCTGALNEWIKGPQYGGSSSLPFLSYVGNVIVRDPAAVVKAMLDEDASWDDVLEELGKWAADQNALFRDMRKIKKNYFDKD